MGSSRNWEDGATVQCNREDSGTARGDREDSGAARHDREGKQGRDDVPLHLMCWEEKGMMDTSEVAAKANFFLRTGAHDLSVSGHRHG